MPQTWHRRCGPHSPTWFERLAASRRATEITRSTSDVAVCCSSDSHSSRVRCCSASNSRTFSIAITAWSAKVSTSLICLSVNGRTAARCRRSTPIGIPSRKSGTPRMVRKSPSLAISRSLYSDRQEHPELSGFALQQNSANCTAASRRKCQMRLVFLELRRVTVACCYVVARVVPGRTEDYTLVGFA